MYFWPLMQSIFFFPRIKLCPCAFWNRNCVGLMGRTQGRQSFGPSLTGPWNIETVATETLQKFVKQQLHCRNSKLTKITSPCLAYILSRSTSRTTTELVHNHNTSYSVHFSHLLAASKNQTLQELQSPWKHLDALSYNRNLHRKTGHVWYGKTQGNGKTFS